SRISTSYPDRLRSFLSPRSSVRIATEPLPSSSKKPSAKPSAPAAGAGRPLMKEAAYAQIKKRILSGEFAQGRFLSERQLAVQLEMSQTPVRAALEKLQIEGLVAISPQQGIVVCEISVHDIADQFEIRETLEVLVARRLAGRLTPAQVGQLRENLDLQRQT